MSTELWRDVPELFGVPSGYQVSNFGNVRGEDGFVCIPSPKGGRRYRYLQAKITDPATGERKNIRTRISLMVGVAFIPLPVRREITRDDIMRNGRFGKWPRWEIVYKDGNTFNDHVDNLEWRGFDSSRYTPKAYKEGRHPTAWKKGEGPNPPKVSDEQVLMVRQAYFAEGGPAAPRGTLTRVCRVWGERLGLNPRTLLPLVVGRRRDIRPEDWERDDTYVSADPKEVWIKHVGDKLP